MEEIIIDHEAPASTRKVYSANAIWVGTFLGGPLSAGYFIAENFKALGQPNRVSPTWIITVVVTALVFGAIFVVPGIEKIPSAVIPACYSSIVYVLVKQYQGEKIQRYISEPGHAFSIWRAVGISLFWCVLTFVLIILLVLLTDDAAILQ